MDLTDKTHVEWKHERRRDCLEDEVGETSNLLTADMKVWDGTSVVGELEWIDDYDYLDDNKKHFASTRGRFQLNSQLNKWLFASTYWELLNNERSSNDPVNGRDVFSVGGESTINVSDRLSLKTWLDRTTVEDANDPTEDGVTDTVVGEVGFNFTRALKSRYVHGIKDIDNVRKDDDFQINDYWELNYRPTEQTELRLTYGYEYENPRDRDDNGPLNFWRTEKIWRLTAHTDF
jgi:hypothetical protein